MNILLFAPFLIIGYLLWEWIRVSQKISSSREIVKDTKPYQLLSQDLKRSLLVLGDSTAVGVGASKPEESLPALVSGAIHAGCVENRAVSGSKIADVLPQIENAHQSHYSYILLQIGANNVVARYSVTGSEQALRSVLEKLPSHEHLIVLMCGNMGVATLLPWFVRPYYTKKTLQYHALFEQVVPEFGGTYINLYTPESEDPFVAQPKVYLAKDEFHPTSAGYKLWFEKVFPLL